MPSSPQEGSDQKILSLEVEHDAPDGRRDAVLKVATESSFLKPIHDNSSNDISDISVSVERPASAPAGSNQARWYHAAFHTVTAVVGAGVLGLPYAISYLGWAGGLFMLILAAAVSFYTAALLAALHEANGERHNRYRDLGEAILGRKRALIFIVPFQFIVMISVGIMFLLTGGFSLQKIQQLAHGASWSLTSWIFIFASSQVLVAQVPDFHSLWWVSVVGALMSVGYSAIAAVASIARSTHNSASYAQRDSGSQHVFGVLTAIGATMFAYGGHSVQVEIQATLKSPPCPRVAMMQGVGAAYVVAVSAYLGVSTSGYAAFGNQVDPDVLLSLEHPRWAIALANAMVVLHVAAGFQVYSMPVWEAIETAWTRSIEALEQRQAALRMVNRTIYVVVGALIAASFPFFGDLMGFIGAIGNVPCTMVLPVVLWLVAKPGRPLPERILNWTIVVGFSLLGLLALIGSVWSIHHKAKNYTFFS